MTDPIHKIMVALAHRGRYGSPAYEQARKLLAQHGGNSKEAQRAASKLPMQAPIPINPPKGRLPAGDPR